MKKVLACILCALVALTLFAACAKNGDEPSNNAADSGTVSIKTIGDALALGESESSVYAYYENAYVYVFLDNGTYWRLTAALNEEQSAALSELDILEDDYEEKLTALITPLEVTNRENLNEQMLTEEDMNALIGKTGEELINDGWTSGMGYNLDTMEFYLEYAPFQYTVTFEKLEQLENTDDFDELEAIRTLKVTSVTFGGLGNSATDLPDGSADGG